LTCNRTGGDWWRMRSPLALQLAREIAAEDNKENDK
jgi:hypothetical protein